MDLLTIQEAADRLRCSTKTIRRAIDAGRLRVVRLGESARSDRIHPDDLAAFVNVSRGGRPRSCRYTAGVGSGGLALVSADAELESRLGVTSPKPKRKN